MEIRYEGGIEIEVVGVKTKSSFRCLDPAAEDFVAAWK